MGQRGDEVSVARFVADQRTMHRVPHTVTCAILGISISWFYKWFGRGPTEQARRRAALDGAPQAAEGHPDLATCRSPGSSAHLGPVHCAYIQGPEN